MRDATFCRLRDMDIVGSLVARLMASFLSFRQAV